MKLGIVLTPLLSTLMDPIMSIHFSFAVHFSLDLQGSASSLTSEPLSGPVVGFNPASDVVFVVAPRLRVICHCRCPVQEESEEWVPFFPSKTIASH